MMSVNSNPLFSVTFGLLIATASFAMMNPAAADEEFYGTVENRPTKNLGIWVVSGQQIEVTDNTKIDNDHGPLVVGSCVEVEHKQGVVKEIESAKPAQCGK